MGSVKNSVEIIESVKSRAMLPDGNATFNTDDFLNILNEELLLGLLSTIMKVHEEFYVYSYDITTTSGITAYDIPSRATGSKVRNIQSRDSSGNLTPMSRVKPEDAYAGNFRFGSFYFKGNQVILLDEPNNSTLQLDIFLRPNQLVNINRGATILSIDTTTGIITFDATVPSHFNFGIKYDFVSHTSPCKIRSFDIVASAKSNTTLTFATTDIPSGLAVGDYITTAEETIVPQMPTEMVPILAQLAAVYCLEAIGDLDGLQLAQRKLERMQNNINTIIDNRSDGNPQKLVNRNSHLRGRGRFSND